MQKILANHKAGKYKTLVHFNNALERMKKKFKKNGQPRKRNEIY